MNKYIKCLLTVVLLMPLFSGQISLAGPKSVEKQPAAKVGKKQPATKSGLKQPATKVGKKQAAAKSAEEINAPVGAAKEKKKRTNLKAKAGGLDTAADDSTPHSIRDTAVHAKSLLSIGVVYVAIILIALAPFLLMVISGWKIFEKAGEAGWQVLIPFYNAFVMTRFCRMPAWSIIVLILPYVNVIGVIWLGLSLAKAFGKSTPYAVGLILLPMIFYPHLAFSDARYSGDDAAGPESVSYTMVS